MAPTGTAAALLLAVAASVGACGGDDDAASDVTVPAEETSTTTSSTTEPTTTTEDPVAAVEQAFYDQWDAFVEITSDPDVDNPLIDEFFTGEAKQAVLDGVSKLLADGHAIRLPDDPSHFEPRVVEIRMASPTHGVVFECTTDGLVVFDRASGEVVNDNVDRLAQRNEFVLKDGQWKIDDLRTASGDEPRCDAA